MAVNQPIIDQTTVDNRPGAVRSLINRFASMILKRDVPEIPETAVVGSVTTETGAADTTYGNVTSPSWKTHNDRRRVYFDLVEMDENDPLVSTALDIHADCTTGYEETDTDGFEWSLEHDNDGARKVLDDIKARLQLGSEIWQVTREFVRNGDAYREVVLDDEGTIQRIKWLPSYQIAPQMDEMGNRAGGWEQRRDGVNYGKPILFEEYQIVPFVYGARRGQYGTGLMQPARRTWKRLTAVEDGMVIARMVRAYDRYLHKVPVKPEWSLDQCQEAIKRYRLNMERKKGLDTDGNVSLRENPFQVNTDIYIPDDGSDKGGIDPLISQNQQLQHIDDVRYHQELLLVRTKVPRRYLNISQTGGGLTDGGLDAEDIQWARTLRQNQAVLRGGMLRLASLALICQGYDPAALGVGMDLPKISTEDMLRNAKVQLTLAQAANFFGQVVGNLPVELIADAFMQLDDDEKEILSEFVENKQAEAERMQKEIAAGNFQPTPGGPGTPVVMPKGIKPVVKPPVIGTKKGVPVQQAAEAVAKLQMLVQAELEQHGVRFGIGYDERVAEARAVLLDAALDV